HAGEPRRGALRLLRERPALATLAAATLLVTYSQSILESIFAIFAMHRYDFGPRTVGLLLFAAALPALVMQGGAVRILAPGRGALPDRRLRHAAGGLAGAPRARDLRGGGASQRHFDRALDDAHRVGRQRHLRGRREHAPVAEVERAAMQRAHHARRTQPP